MDHLVCDLCGIDIAFNEYCNNNALCNSCYRKDVERPKETVIVRGCDNYLNCGQEANVSVGDGLLCDLCIKKAHSDVKKVFIESATGKEARTKFIKGLQRALSVEITT